MKQDKQIELLNDVKDGESNCCGASMYGDICSSCKEHSVDINEELEERSDLEELAKDNYLNR